MGAVFHISEEEAVRDFAGLLARVYAGEEAVVEGAGRAVVMKASGVNSSQPPCSHAPDVDGGGALSAIRGKTAEEILSDFARWEAEHGKLTFDPAFADDVAEAHQLYNQPLDDSLWD